LLPKDNAREVTDYKEIEADAKSMLELLDYGIYINGSRRGAVALAHAQVSRTPFNFFVIDKAYRSMFNSRRVIINPKIVEQNDLVPFQEGCLSFDSKPTNTRRFRNLRVQWQYPDGSGVLNHARTDYFSDLAAMVLQHEIDHARGKNIHEEFAEYNRLEEAVNK
jgi:peptide deformylase